MAIISNHAQERYAERIMDKDCKSDIAVYIARNKDKINTDINKMIEFGIVIYSGKLEKNQNTINVILKDTWILLLDTKTDKVITLYAIDLGVGDEFNYNYINLLLNKLKEAKKIYNEKNEELIKITEDLKAQFESNKEKINHYRKLANDLEKANENITNSINDYETMRYVAEEDVRDIIEILIGKKIK